MYKKTRFDISLTDALVEYLEAHGFENVRITQGSRGINIIASCPFAETHHQSGRDAHPSWGLLVDAGVWSCFACKRKGNLYTLASELGIPVFDAGSRSMLTLEESFERIKRELRKKDAPPPAPIMNLPDNFSFFNFSIGSKALDWLMGKGYAATTIQFFGIGYNKDTQNPVFPISNDQGYIVGWQERNLRFPRSQPKYWFSESLAKREVLYNYHWAKRQAAECVMVEAVLSVMALHEAGVAGISPLSASLSVQQAGKLGVFKKVTICFDADIAGQVALEQAKKMLAHAPFEVYAVTPPTKIHRMVRQDILPLLKTRQRVKI